MDKEFITHIFQLNFGPTIALIFIILFIIINNPYDKHISNLFRNAIILLICLLLVENCDMYVAMYHPDSINRVITAICGYNVRLWVLVSIINIMIRREFRSNVTKLLLALPSVITFLVTMTVFNTHLMFWYSPDGTINRGPLSFTPHLACVVYGIYIIVYSIERAKKMNKPEESSLLVIGTILMFVGVVAESITQERGLLITLSAMVLIFYYLYMYLEHFKMDELTGVFNRASFNADIVRRKHAITAVASIDLNNLKTTNDTFGHLAGDKAIINTSVLINKQLNTKSRLYRIGGDEFAILFTNLDESQVWNVIFNIKKAIQESPYSLSIGVCMNSNDKDIKEIFEEADKRMYKEKRKTKAII